MDEELVKPIPRMDLAQWRFEMLNAGTIEGIDTAALKDKMMELIKQDNMAPFYKEVCSELKWDLDEGLVASLQQACDEKVKALDVKIEEAEKSLGETEIREAMLEKSEHFATIGDKENAVESYKKTLEKTVALGQKLDIVFALIRIGFFTSDNAMVAQYIDKAKTLIEEGGDWDRRNRLKVYEGVYRMAIRDFDRAAKLFNDTVSTFTSVELVDYATFVSYAVLTSALALDRVDLAKKVIASPEMHEVAQERPIVRDYVKSLYDCDYGAFFRALAEVEVLFKRDRYLHAHYRYYTREMRIVAYAQLLESYRSVTLASVAKSFAVSEAFVDNELSRFIAGGRLSCRIDKVNGVIETNRHDIKTSQYHSTIKQGDVLVNRLQKLGRVINI